MKTAAYLLYVGLDFREKIDKLDVRSHQQHSRGSRRQRKLAVQELELHHGTANTNAQSNASNINTARRKYIITLLA